MKNLLKNLMALSLSLIFLISFSTNVAFANTSYNYAVLDFYSSNKDVHLPTVQGSFFAGGQFSIKNYRVDYFTPYLYSETETKFKAKACAVFTDKGEIVTKDMTSIGMYTFDEVNFDIPSDATKVELWFEYTNQNGTIKYDSRNGKNYKFPIGQLTSSAVITYDNEWNEKVSGEIKAGNKFQIIYDSTRLPHNRDSKYGFPVWSISANVKFLPSNEIQTCYLTFVEGQNIFMRTSDSVYVPYGTEKIEMWFVNTGYYGSTYYDSNMNQNYSFNVK